MTRQRWLVVLVLVAFALGYLAGSHMAGRNTWKVYEFGPNRVGLERVNLRTGTTQFSGFGCPWFATWPEAYRCMLTIERGQ